MSNCTFCGQSLSELDVRAGRCSECGMIIGADSDVTAATIWSGSFDHDLSPSMSLKGDSSTSDSAAQSNLVVKSRVFRQVTEPVLEGTDYRIEGELGKGGMGVVYSAWQTSIDRQVAVKMLQPRLSGDRDQVQKFLAEAVVTGDLDHPNIVPIYDLGTNEDGHAFYAMKRVEGTRWKDTIRTNSLHENLDILMKVSDAIAMAHSRGVIHRDLKPENVMIGGFGEVLVMDWGLALTTDSFQKVGGIRQSASRESTPVGTPVYMAPEMASGQVTRVSAQSDIYLLGAILFEILTGMGPHPGRSAMKCLLAALRNEIVETPHTGELMDVARRAMATNPEERYETVGAFQAAVRECQEHSESITLADKAEQNLQQARDASSRSDDAYELFQQALFGFKEAWALWEGNSRAKAGISKSRLEYAEAALARGDLDLATSVLDTDDAAHTDVYMRVEDARKERDQRQQRLKTARRVMVGMAATLMIVISGALFFVNGERQKALAAADAEKVAKEAAVVAQQDAEAAAEAEKKAKLAEAAEREKAQALAIAEKKAKDEALNAKRAAEAAAVAEKKAREEAVAAAAAEKKAKDAAVVAQMKAEEEEKKAKLAAEAEKKAKDAAIVAQKKAEEERKKAVAAKEAEEKEREKAVAAAAAEKKAKEAAIVAQKKAEEERKKAVAAKEAEEKERKKAVAAAEAEMKAKLAEAAERKKAEALAVAEKKAKEEAVKAQEKAVAAATAEKKAKDAAVVAQKKAEAAAIAEKKAKEAEKAEREKAVKLAIAEAKAKEEALAAKKKAEEEEKKAVAAAVAEKKAREEAVAAAEAEKKAKEAAVIAQKKAEEEEKKALAAAEAEKKAKEAQEYEAYVAQIGLAAARIDENAFESAVQLLKNCDERLRDWEWGRLMYLCSQSKQTWEVPAALNAIDVTADGERIAISGWNGLVEIRDAKTGELIHTLPHQADLVHAVAFSPDGRLVATGSGDGSGFVQLWDVASGKRLPVQFAADSNQPPYGSTHTDAVLHVAFSPDGTQLVSTSYDRTARVWDVETGRQVSLHHGHLGWVWSAEFSRDGRRLVTSGQDGTAVVWDLSTGRQSPPFTGHEGPVYAAVFSPDGSHVVSAGYDRRLLRWNPADLKQPKLADLLGGGQVEAVAFDEFEGHTDAIRSLRFSRDGSLMLTSGHDNTIRIWNAESGKLVRTFRGHDSWVRSCVFAEGGRYVLSASFDASVKKWSIEEYEEIRVLQGRVLDGHEGQPVLSARFSPDGKQIVTASRDRSARTWETKTGKSLVTLVEGHQYLASTAVFFRDGRTIVTAAGDGTARVWDVATGAELADINGTGMSSAIALSHDERFLLTGGENREARLWQLTPRADGMEARLVRRFSGHGSEITAVAFSIDDNLVYTGDARGYGRLWNTQTGELARRLDGHTLKIMQAVFLPGGRHLLTASGDNTVARWEIATGRELRDQVLRHPDKVISLSTSANGTRGVTSCEDGKVRVWDLTAARVLRTLETPQTLVNSVAMSADGSRVVTADPDADTVLLWNARTGEQLQAGGEAAGNSDWMNLQSEGAQVWTVHFAPDGRSLLTVGGDDARLWDLESGTQQISFRQHSSVTAANFSPDGKLVVTGSWDNAAKIWDVASGQAKQRLEGAHRGNVNSAVFSPDQEGRHVLTGSDDGTAVIWNVVDGTVLRTLAGHEGQVLDAVFSPDGKLIATACSDGEIRIWEADSGKLQRRLTGHEDAVHCVRFSNDGQRLVSGGDDDTARTWNLATGEVELVLAGHTASVTCVAFSSGGSRVLTGSRDTTVKLWDALLQRPTDVDDSEKTDDGPPQAREILTLAGHNREVTSVAFSPDGNLALTAADDGKAIVWLTVDWRGKLAGKPPVAAPRPVAVTVTTSAVLLGAGK